MDDQNREEATPPPPPTGPPAVTNDSIFNTNKGAFVGVVALALGLMLFVGGGIAVVAFGGSGSYGCVDYAEMTWDQKRTVLRDASEEVGLEHHEGEGTIELGVNTWYLQQSNDLCRQVGDALTVDDVAVLLACDNSGNSCSEAEQIVDDLRA